MTAANVKPIVVAVDGSESALRATRWAAAEAAAQNRALTVVGVSSYPAAAFPVPASAPAMEALDEATRTVVADAAQQARTIAPGIPVRTETLRGPVIPALLDLADGADLLVCGSRGLGGFAGLMLGSVGAALAASAAAPVVVVRGEGDLPTAGPVVVGLDGSDTSDRALGAALDIASRRGADLDAVLCWDDPLRDVPGSPSYGPEGQATWLQRAEEVLSQRLAGWREKYPDVTINRQVVRGLPAAELRQRSTAAQLVVVGSRGRGGFTGLLLGSTSRALIHSADCPVLVVRPD